VGSGGLFKTPTLRNADFNAPYFTTVASTATTRSWRISTVSSISACRRRTARSRRLSHRGGHGTLPYEHDGAGASLKEVNEFANVLATAIPAGDKDVVALASTHRHELRELTERYPIAKTPASQAATRNASQARMRWKEVVLTLRRIDMAVAEGRTGDGVGGHNRTIAISWPPAVPALLAGAEPWSLF